MIFKPFWQQQDELLTTLKAEKTGFLLPFRILSNYKVKTVL